jgi:hypothetical protein
MNKSLNNKEKSAYRRAKDRKSTENPKRGTGHLKNMAKQKKQQSKLRNSSWL